MKTLRSSYVLPLIVVVAALGAAPLWADDAPPAAIPSRGWSQEIWQAALRGDKDAVDQSLTAVPQALMQGENGVKFRQSLDLLHANLQKAAQQKTVARDEARTAMLEAAAQDELTSALRKAVEVQMVSPDLDSALADADISSLIAKARALVPQMEQEGDWLYAQELLFLVKTLYEDTSHRDQYASLSKDLDWVNSRVSLLARYAPKRLHDLRQRRAQRVGDKALADFNPAAAEDWRERLKGVDARLLKESLRLAAAEHIEAQGWPPLLRGGLEALKILASTSSLDETFPLLRDAEKVSRWENFIDSELQAIEAPKAALDQWTLTRLLDGLVLMNQDTIQLPNGILYREFGDGAMSELDEYSEIIWPDKLARFNQSTEGKFVGVGILIRHNDAREILVVNPLEGTPAYFGGIKPDDIIAEVDGESAVGWSLNDAVDRITGRKGSEVVLGIRRKDVPDVLNIVLSRDEIKLRTVMGWWKRDLHPDGAPDWDWYVDPVNRIAYVKLTQFTEDTYPDLLEAYEEMSVEGKPNGLILDLRYNPGGLLTSAFYISNLFVKSGLIVSGENKDGQKAFADMRASPSRAVLNDLPTVVLVNKGSASASEIVSGCLQAHSTAVVVGERTYGKGSVQTVPTTATNARVKITTQYYRLPPGPGEEKGRLVHKRLDATDWGVDPDLLVPMTPAQLIGSLDLRQEADLIPQDPDGTLRPDSPDRPDVSRMLTEGLDPQLETALLLLQARVLGEVGNGTKQASIVPEPQVIAH